jgi:hypothetical protein
MKEFKLEFEIRKQMGVDQMCQTDDYLQSIELENG